MSEHAGASDEFLAAVGKMIAKLARPDVLQRDDASSALQRLTETGAAALRVSRASVWRFSEDGTYLECMDMFEADSNRHVVGLKLPASIAPEYFRTLATERTVAVHDANRDLRAMELAEYLREHDIGAMLDAPIWLSGRLAGVVCHEHVGAPRNWSHWEELVAGTLADFAAVMLGTNDRLRHAEALAAYGTRLEVLVEERTRSLREQQLLLQTVFSTAPFGMAFFDRELRYLHINDWLAKLNGVPAEATIGRRPVDVIPDPGVGQGAEWMLQTVFETGAPTKPFEASKGDGRAFLISAYPVEINGAVVQACCVVVDVTLQREGERERARLLERERAAREEAEAANRAKDEFLAMLGHELRNPLAPIQTALNLMDGLGEVAQKERAVIARQVSHLKRLVDDLLDVTRVTRGKLELRSEPLELSRVVSRGIEIASPLLERRQQFLDVDVAEKGLCTDGDLDRLGQVVSNLLTNASKFTPVGGRVSLRCFRDEQGLKLVVSDTGEGISPELLPRLFDAFVQGERKLEQSQGGLGLGLAIVNGIVAAHGGWVSAYSAGLGKGSAFTVCLQSGENVEVTRPSPPVLPVSAPSTTSRRILVVDDNQDAAEMLAMALSSLGHHTATAFDGPMALELAESFRPELAVLDLGLPVMDGYELAVQLKALLPHSDVKLVALTGYGQARDRERSKQAGFDQHMTKPVDAVELERVVSLAFQ